MLLDFPLVRQVLLPNNIYSIAAVSRRLPKQALSYARKASSVECVTMFYVAKERAVPNSKLSRLIEILNHIRFIFPPLKKLLFEMFWFVFAVVEIVRFLRSLL